MLLTKLRMFAPSTCQIICISATIGGVEPVVDWLDAVFFCTNYRPVKLQEFVAFGPNVYGLDMPAAGTAADTSVPGTNAKFQHPSTATQSLATSIPADVLQAVNDANLSYQRTLSVQVPAKQQFAAQVAVQLALEVADVCYQPKDSLFSWLLLLIARFTKYSCTVLKRHVIYVTSLGNVVDLKPSPYKRNCKFLFGQQPWHGAWRWSCFCAKMHPCTLQCRTM
jgi:hypothetical protein